MKLREIQRISNKIRECIVIEIQNCPPDDIAGFIDNLSTELKELVLEEIEYGRRKYKQ